jgi:hypothetical protein
MINKAIIFSIDAHAKQFKKGTKTPFLIGFLIIVCILINGIPASAVNASEVADKLNQIAQKYPDGSFFSADGQACTHTHDLTCSNCELLKIYPDLKDKVSNAWTCCAFARYVYYELFHINSYSISSNSKEVSLADAKAGDLVMFYNGASVTHYAIYLYSDGITGKYYLYESNYVVPNKVRYGGAYSAVQLANVKIWHANNYDADSDSATDIDTGGSVPDGSLSTTVPMASPTPTLSPIPTATSTSVPTPMPTTSPSPMPTLQPVPESNPVQTPTPMVLLVPDPNPEQAPTQMPLLDSVPKPAPGIQSLPGKSTKISVTNIKISKTRVELGKGKTSKLNAMIVPQKASNKKVIWLSNNKSIAMVSATGIVKGIRKGTTYIYVISADGKKEARCWVIVY